MPKRLAALLFALCAAVTAARAETVRLSNGGAVQGSVLSSDGGTLRLLTKTGEVALPKDMVVSVSPDRYAVKLKDGRTLEGAITDIGDDKLVLETSSGTVTLWRSEIASIAAQEPAPATGTAQQPAATSVPPATAPVTVAPATTVPSASAKTQTVPAAAPTTAAPAATVTAASAQTQAAPSAVTTTATTSTTASAPTTVPTKPAGPSTALQPAAAATVQTAGTGSATAAPKPAQTPAATPVITPAMAHPPVSAKGTDAGAPLPGRFEGAIGYILETDYTNGGPCGELAYMQHVYGGYNEGDILLEAGLGAGAARAGTKDIDGLVSGSLTMVPLTARMRVSMQSEGFRSFLMAGAGYYLFGRSSSSSYSAATISETAADRPGFLLAAGASTSIGDTSVFLLLTKHFVSTDISARTYDSDTGKYSSYSRELDLSPFSFQAGVTLDF